MFKVVWDRENNGVRLTMAPLPDEALNVSPRPVFWEELDFYELNKYGWHYPRSNAPLLWACERRYYYKGELVLAIVGGNLFDKPKVVVLQQNLDIEEIDLEILRRNNEDSMFLLEHEAMTFIDSIFSSHFGSKSDNSNSDISYDELATRVQQKTKIEQTIVQEDCGSLDIMPLTKAEMLGKKKIFNSNIETIIMSFSGGKDSQVVLDLVSRVLPTSKFVIIYSDTGYELPTSLSLYSETKKFYSGKYPDLKFYTASNHKNVLEYWDELDTPSKVHRWCCSVMKTAPLYRLVKDINGSGKQPNVMAFEGVRAEESSKRATYLRIGKGVKHNNVVNVRPIFDWNTTEVWLYILSNQLPLNPAYRKGLSRVGCVICPLSSELGDCLDNHFFPETAAPFIQKLRQNAENAGIVNVDKYLKERKWKVRAGGNRHYSESDVSYKQKETDLFVKVTNPKEDIFQWIKVIGDYKIEKFSNYSFNIHINFRNQIYILNINFKKSVLEINIKDGASDVVFTSLIKKVLNKTTFCVHCEVCEVECPTGALSVVPNVRIDETKCIHCHKCLNFKDDGCIAANSIRATLTNNIKLGTMTPINKINTFGLRKNWMKIFLEQKSEFFSSDTHGLNVKKQLPIFLNWLRDAELVNIKEKTWTPTAEMLAPVFKDDESVFWELVWINLANNSEICAWFNQNISFQKFFTREELSIILEDSFPDATFNVRENALKALINTFKESPYGDLMKLGLIRKEGNKTSIVRLPYNSLSLVATAFSLYRYAEKSKRYSLTISEFYDTRQNDGIVRQFGIERDAFEKALRSLDQNSNHVLRAELKMGLDNIVLREDLNSGDILKLML